MFAPPPVQLTREQIERLKQERLAREQAKLEKGESNTSAQSGGKLSKTESPTSSLQQTESQSPRTRRGLFGKSAKGKVQVSKPIPFSPTSPTSQVSQRSGSIGPTSPASPQKSALSAPAPPPPPPPPVPAPAPARETPGQRAERRDSGKGQTSKQNAGEQAANASPFTNAPRRAPAPPKRPARPPEELVLPILPGSFPGIDGPPSAPPQKSPPPPPVPQKSPRRHSSTIRAPQPRLPDTNRSILDDKTLNQALSALKVSEDSKPAEDERPGHLARASTAPVGSVKPMPKKVKRTSGDSSDSKRLSGVQSGKIDKAPKKRASAVASLEATLMELEYPGMKLPRRATDGSIRPVRISTPPREMQLPQLPWKRRRKGETMSMLLDAGFFPVKEVTMHNKKNPNVSIHIPVPLTLRDKDLPDTPGSMLATPIEMYHPGPKRSLPPLPRDRKLGKLKRSPLGQVSSTNAKRNSGTLSPERLSAIPELASVNGSVNENTPPSSGVATPVATQIHLRGGSVVTVTPPELTAWRQHLYIQGPIKLPKPTIMPRKNSLASLEAFQDAIDEIYQTALTVPRRRSDDAVLEDVCEWFDDFGFAEVKYEGDVMMVEDINLDEADELAEVDSQGQRFSTPPPGLEASPLEQVVAMQVVETFSPPPMRRLPALPAVENEETLRARGIARLSQLSAGSGGTRKGSMASGRSARADSIIVTSMLEGSLPTSASPPPPDPEEEDELMPMVMDHGGMDWDDDIEELNGHTPWVAPAILRKKRGTPNNGVSIRESRNPVLKMRRLMATASAIL